MSKDDSTTIQITTDQVIANTLASLRNDSPRDGEAGAGLHNKKADRGEFLASLEEKMWH